MKGLSLVFVITSVAVIKYSEKKKKKTSREERLVLVHGSRFQAITTGKPKGQQVEIDISHPHSRAEKNRHMLAAADLFRK